MLGVGSNFPKFSLTAVTSTEPGKEFKVINNDSYKGQWKIYFFWPKDFTFICPTELKGFEELNSEFTSRNAQLFGCSTDSEFVHLSWRQDNEDLHDIPFPMISDANKELCTKLGILDPTEGVAQRATFVVDTEDMIRHVSVHDLTVGRNPSEILRTLDALLTDQLCQCNWEPGQETLGPKPAI